MHKINTRGIIPDEEAIAVGKEVTELETKGDTI